MLLCAFNKSECLAMTALGDLVRDIGTAVRYCSPELRHDRIIKLLQESEIDDVERSQELLNFTEEDMSSECKYTRNRLLQLVGEDGTQCQVLLLIWKREQGSEIHDHPFSECYVKIVQGEMLEEIYNHDKSLKTKGKLTSGEVTHMNDGKGLHKMTNLSGREVAITFHVYTSNMKSENQMQRGKHPLGAIYRDYSDFFL